MNNQPSMVSPRDTNNIFDSDLFFHNAYIPSRNDGGICVDLKDGDNHLTEWRGITSELFVSNPSSLLGFSCYFLHLCCGYRMHRYTIKKHLRCSYIGCSRTHTLIIPEVAVCKKCGASKVICDGLA